MWGLLNCIETKVLSTCFYLKYLKKKQIELTLDLFSAHDSWRKIFLMLPSISWPNFIVWLSLLLKILGNMCIAIIFFEVDDVINFEINHNCKWQKKLGQKFNFRKNHELLRWEKKHFPSILKGLSLALILFFFLNLNSVNQCGAFVVKL